MNAHERRINREKIRRYRERHAKRIANEYYFRVTPETNHDGQNHVVELCHADGLPAAVVLVRPGASWRALYASAGPVGEWLRSLAADGLEPAVSYRWVTGAGFSREEAGRLARGRLEQIRAWCGQEQPGWLVSGRVVLAECSDRAGRAGGRRAADNARCNSASRL